MVFYFAPEKFVLALQINAFKYSKLLMFFKYSFSWLLFLIPVFFSQNFANAQNKVVDGKYHKKGTLAFHWGYNRGYFSKTNLHFTGPNYDFTLYNIEATDRPTPFSAVYFNPSTISIPQYNYRFCYYITDRLGISVGTDHMKYVVTQNQMTTISGVITPEASEKYAGSYLNQPIELKEDLLKFEHTDGFNLVSLEFEYLQPLVAIPAAKLNFYWNSGIGGVWVVTKTDVRVFGDGLDNDFHVAGYTMTGKTGPRMEFKNRFYVAAELKGGYASLPAVLIKNSAPEIGDHNLTFLEYYVVAGVNINLKKRSK